MKNYQHKRRQFLKNIGLTTLGMSSMPASVLSMKTWAAAAANNSSLTDDYKALVCFFMYGGNDGFNMLVPKENEAYNEYQTTRSNLALEQSDLLSINPLNNEGPELGLHPNLSGVQDLFNTDKLSFICNIGPKYQEITTKDDLANQRNLPLSLFSHNDQRRQWHTAEVRQRIDVGWAGRIADSLASLNANQNISMNISMSNSPRFLKGLDTASYSLTKRGPQSSLFYHPNNSPNDFYGQRTTAINAMYNHDYQDAFYNNFNSVFRTAIDTNIAYKAALDTFENNGGLTATFSSTTFSKDLEMVAKSIAIGEDLGFSRQIFFVQFTGFDNHSDFWIDHNKRMNDLSVGLSEFYTALEELQKENNVVTFSMSDFGRTLTSNGNGSDHAWGSPAIVMGGTPVVGRSLFGNYPSLALGADLVYGSKGIVIPGLATDCYFAELAHWFGVSKSELAEIVPNLGAFYDVSSDTLPIGFLNV